MTRKFSSYGPISISQHYYAPRQALIDQAYLQLVGETPAEGGHYITVWAPRQRGKTWLFQQTIQRIKALGEFEVIFLSLQSLLDMTDSRDILHEVIRKLSFWLGRELPLLDEWRDLSQLFSPTYLSKPLILILDEFDTLDEAAITQFVSQLRNIYIERESELNVPRPEKRIWLHG